jgi:hypothetical protein
VEQHSLDSDQSLNRKRCCYQFASCGTKNEKKVRKSRPGVLAKKLRGCKGRKEGGVRSVGGGQVTPSPLPPTPTVKSARTPAVKVVRSVVLPLVLPPLRREGPHRE